MRKPKNKRKGYRNDGPSRANHVNQLFAFGLAYFFVFGNLFGDEIHFCYEAVGNDLDRFFFGFGVDGGV